MRRTLLPVILVALLAASCGGESSDGLDAACEGYQDYAQAATSDPAAAAEAWTELVDELPDDAPGATAAGSPAVIDYLLNNCGDQAFAAFATAASPEYLRFARLEPGDAADDPVAAACDRFVNFVQVYLTSGDTAAHGEAWFAITRVGPPEVAGPAQEFIDADGDERVAARAAVLAWVDDRCGVEGSFALAALDGRTSLPILQF